MSARWIAVVAVAGVFLGCKNDCQSTAETLCETSMKENYEKLEQKLGAKWVEDALKKCVAEQVLRCER
jgi:hypothetical protein